MSVVRWQVIKNKTVNFSFETEHQTESGLGESWDKEGSPTLSLSTSNVQHNIYSQKIVGASDGDGISQIFDVSDISGTDFALKFYVYITAGTLSVTIEGLDANDNVLGTLFSDTYTTNAELTVQTETFSNIISGETSISHMKITLAQSGATAMTCYLDAVMVYENSNVTVGINPTSFDYDKISMAQFSQTIEGDEVKIVPLDTPKRTAMENISPIWMWLTEAQKNIFEDLVGEEIVIITHEDKLINADVTRGRVTYIQRQDPQLYEFYMELRYVNR